MTKKEFDILLKKYVDLIVVKGLNFKKGRIVYISSDTDQLDFVNLLVEKCYIEGAKEVRVSLKYRPIENTILKYEASDEMGTLLPYEKEKLLFKQKTKAAHISIESFDPCWVEKGLESKYLYTYFLKRKNIKTLLSDDPKEGPYTIVSAPSKTWSKRLFPKLSEENAILKHWEIIFKCAHISLKEDPIKSWDKHVLEIKKHSDWLNSLKIKTLYYKNSLGTNLKVGLIKNTHFADAADYDESEGHRPFYSNIPTEEVFNSPNKFETEGIVYSSKPLSYDGVIIDKFYIKFHEGKAIEAHAKVGEKFLKDLLNFDKGSCYLGEAALVPIDSPVNQTGILFQNILYDENAACHFALGNSYTYTYNNHTKYNRKYFDKLGFNKSSIHVDFMIGTPDLEVIAETFDGKKVKIFKNGRFTK